MEIDWDDWDDPDDFFYTRTEDEAEAWDGSYGVEAMNDAEKEELLLQILKLQEELKQDLRSTMRSTLEEVFSELREERSGGFRSCEAIQDRTIEPVDHIPKPDYRNTLGISEEVEGVNRDFQKPAVKDDDKVEIATTTVNNQAQLEVISNSPINLPSKCLINCLDKSKSEVIARTWSEFKEMPEKGVGLSMNSDALTQPRVKELVGSDDAFFVFFDPATHDLSYEGINAMSLLWGLIRLNIAITAMEFLDSMNVALLNLMNTENSVWFRGPNPGGTEKISWFAYYGKGCLKNAVNVLVMKQDGKMLTLAKKMNGVIVFDWHCDGLEWLWDGLYMESFLKKCKAADMFSPVGCPPNVDVDCLISLVEDYVIRGECHDSDPMIYYILNQDLKVENVPGSDGIGFNLQSAVPKLSCYLLGKLLAATFNSSTVLTLKRLIGHFWDYEYAKHAADIGAKMTIMGSDQLSASSKSDLVALLMVAHNFVLLRHMDTPHSEHIVHLLDEVLWHRVVKKDHRIIPPIGGRLQVIGITENNRVITELELLVQIMGPHKHVDQVASSFQMAFDTRFVEKLQVIKSSHPAAWCEILEQSLIWFRSSAPGGTRPWNLDFKKKTNP